MLSVYTVNQAAEWERSVSSFENYDVYYAREYVLSLKEHGDGEPLLVEYKDASSHFCYVVMESDISDFQSYKGRIEPDTMFDWETPYGYGGPLSNAAVPDSSQRRFLCELEDYSKERGVVSQFMRLHPLLANHLTLPLVADIRHLHDTVYMDTESADLILANMDSKNRNMIRKAQRNGVEIASKPMEEYADFARLYRDTMIRDNAAEYYLFDNGYFEALTAFGQHARLFYAFHDGKPIAAAIMLFNDRFMHYHLSGSEYESRTLAPSNLLLYEAAVWASEQGITRFHLGGGMRDDDNLFRFKKKFNKNGRLPFYVGRTIIDREKYEELLSLRQATEPEFNPDNDFMIQYRKPISYVGQA